MNKKFLVLVVVFVIFFSQSLMARKDVKAGFGFESGVNLSLYSNDPSYFIGDLHAFKVGLSFAVNDPRELWHEHTQYAYDLPGANKDKKNRDKAIAEGNTIAERDQESRIVRPKEIYDAKDRPHNSWGGLFTAGFAYNAGKTGIFFGQEFSKSPMNGFYITADAVYSIEMAKNQYFFFIGIGAGFYYYKIDAKGASHLSMPLSIRLPTGFRIFMDKYSEFFIQITPALALVNGYDTGFLYNGTKHFDNQILSTNIFLETMLGFRFWPTS